MHIPFPPEADPPLEDTLSLQHSVTISLGVLVFHLVTYGALSLVARMANLKIIKELRNKTQASISDCRKALEEAGGDLEKAVELLRRRGKLIAQKKSSRAANAGVIDAYVHQNGRVGVLVELRCETDFVARNEIFLNLAHDLALQVAAMNPMYVSPDEVPGEVIEQERVNLAEELRSSGKPEEIIGKIIQGKLTKFLEERSLLTQAFVKDPSKKVKDLITESVGRLGENVRVERFVRFEF